MWYGLEQERPIFSEVPIHDAGYSKQLTEELNTTHFSTMDLYISVFKVNGHLMVHAELMG